jgi:UDP-glucose 4-epimerase
MKQENILILGADGFIGSSMAASLLRDSKYQISAFDFFKDGKSKNLEGYRGIIEFASGDFLNRKDLKKALQNVDYVFHFLSSTTPGSSMNDPLIDINTNVIGMLSLLDECVAAKVKKVIFSSSGGTVYGDQGKLKYSENDNTNPISPYGISKLTIEKYLEYYKINHGLDYLILRYSNLYGPGQNISGTQGIIPIFLNLISHNEPITIYGDGENVRDYLYIDDAIEITKQLFNKENKYNLYNVGSGQGESTNEIIKAIEKIINKKAIINWLPDRKIDVKRIILDTTRLTNEIKYSPKVTVGDGIKKTWDWLEKRS